MKAMQINEFGGPEVMKYQDVADPTPGEGEAVVEIQAAGVNFTDVYSRQGINPGPPLPRTIGVEGAGVVKAIGPGVTEVKVGDEVTYCTAPGAYAELALVPKNTVPLDVKSAQQTLRLLDRLEELDDVQKVYTNADFPDEALEQYQAEG